MLIIEPLPKHSFYNVIIKILLQYILLYKQAGLPQCQELVITNIDKANKISKRYRIQQLYYLNTLFLNWDCTLYFIQVFLKRQVQANLFFLLLCLLIGTNINVTCTSFYAYYTLVYFRPKLKSNSLAQDPILPALLLIIIFNKITDKLYTEFHSVPFFKFIQQLRQQFSNSSTFAKFILYS